VVDYQIDALVVYFPKAVLTYWLYISAYNQTIVQFSTTTPVPLSPQATPTTSEPSFYYDLPYTESQIAFLTIIDILMKGLNHVIEHSFTFLLSSPVAVLFLSSFNFFNLSSLYVLLQIRTPYKIFFYYSELFNTCQPNMLDRLGIMPELEALSQDRVTDVRANYFGICSDLLSQNFTDLLLLVINVMIVELVLVLISKRGLKWQKEHRWLSGQRASIYWGLVVSMMPDLVLPWRFSIGQGAHNLQMRLNFAGQQLIFGLFIFLLIYAFFSELRTALRLKKNQFIRVSLRKWWVSFENFVYPLLILSENPNYFTVVIGLSQLVHLYTAFSVPKMKILAILKAFYPLAFLACFIGFQYMENELLLSYLVVICPSIFLLGSLHFLLESTVQTFKYCYQIIRKICRKIGRNQVGNQ
jgi:hypothetical protein